MDQEHKYRTFLLGPGITAVSMSEGCSVFEQSSASPYFVYWAKDTEDSLLKTSLWRQLKNIIMLQGAGKVKQKWERGQTMTVLSPEVCLWHLFKGRNTLWIKCHRQILVPSHQLPAHPNRSSQASQTGAGDFLWGMFPTPLPQRLLSSTMWWRRKPKHYCLATSADVVVPGKIIVNSFNSERIESLLKYKRSKTWPRQLHNWGIMKVLTAFTFKFPPKSPGIAAG